MKLSIPVFIFAALLVPINNTLADGQAEQLAEPFVALNPKGKPVAIESAQCFKDAQTGLFWEAKTTAIGAHNAKLKYRWGGLGAQPVGEIFFDDWNVLVNTANKNALCGYSDWRVPAIDELKQFYQQYQQAKSRGTDIFPADAPLIYWSSSAYANYPEHAQTVDFSNGNSNYFNGFRGERLAVILVRG